MSNEEVCPVCGYPEFDPRCEHWEQIMSNDEAVRLTREQIEYIHCSARAYMDDADRTMLDKLCDMALRSDRDAIIEECARIIEKRAKSLALPHGELDEHDEAAIRFAQLRRTEATGMARYMMIAAESIRALKTPKEPTDG